MPAPGAAVDLFVAYEPSRRADAFTVVSRARRAGRAAQMELAGRSLKGQLKQASRTGARFVAVLREDGSVLQDTEDHGEAHIDAHPDTDGIVAAVLRNLGAGSL